MISILKALFSALCLLLIVTVVAIAIFCAITFGCSAVGYGPELASLEDQATKGIASFQPVLLVRVYGVALEGPPGPPVVTTDVDEILGHKNSEPMRINLSYWAHGVRFLPPLEAIAAFADTVWHVLVANSWIGRGFVIFQLVIGALLSALVIGLLNWNGRIHPWGVTALMRIGTMVLGSFSAFVVQRLMDVGQHLTFLQFGALAFGSGGTGGGLSLAHKATEAWFDTGDEPKFRG